MSISKIVSNDEFNKMISGQRITEGYKQQVKMSLLGNGIKKSGEDYSTITV